MQRCLDGEGAAGIGGGSTPERGVAFEDEHPRPGMGQERRGGEAAEAGADDDSVETVGGGNGA